MSDPDRRTDDAVLAEIGERLTAARLSRDRTQAELAREAGVSKRTVERMEAGRSSQMTSFIRVLRALGLLAGFEAWLPPARPGPMDLLRGGGEAPRRASGRRGRGADEPSAGEPWTWGEDG